MQEESGGDQAEVRSERRCRRRVEETRQRWGLYLGDALINLVFE